jgi:hypothetical protein
MSDRVIVIGVPMVVLLGILVLFGVTWLFHHHHWRPFAGIFLFVIGLGVFWTLMARNAAVEQFEPPLTPQTRPPFEIGRDTAARMRVEPAIGAKSMTTRTGGNGDQIVAEKPISSASPSTASAPTKADVRSPTSADVRSPISDKKPDWVDRPPQSEKLDGQQKYVAAAKSGPYATSAECERAIIPVINEIVGRYAADYLMEPPDGELTLDPNYIRNELVKDSYLGTENSSVGPMLQLHNLLVFDDAVRYELERRSRTARVTVRLEYAAAGTALTLLVLGGVYSLLRKGERGTSAAAK